MTFQPDILISWDISEKDIPTIIITSLEYDSKLKHIVADVLCRIDASELNSGVISINQLIAKHHLYKSKKETEEAIAELQNLKLFKKEGE